MSRLQSKNRSIWQVVRTYKLNSLFVRNLLVIFIVIAIPFTGIWLIMNQHSRAILEDEISAVHLNSLSRISEVSDSVMAQTDRMATKLALLPDAQAFMKFPDYMRNFQTGVINLGRSISSFIHVHDYIDSIHLYSEVNQFIISNNNNTAAASFRDNNWLGEYARQANDRSWTMTRKKFDRYPYLLSVVRPAASIDRYMAGAVIINLDIQRLGMLLNQTERADGELIYIISNTGEIIYSQDTGQLFADAGQVPALSGTAVVMQAESRIVRHEKDRYVVSVIPSSTMPWRYVSILPMVHVEEQVQTMNRFYSMVLAGSAVAVLLAVILISLRTYGPLKRLLTLIDNPEAWEERRQRRPSKSRERLNEDELHYIADGILSTAKSRQAAEKELQHRIELLGKAQTAALQAQINPHLLSNTLDSMQWMAMELTGGRNEISRMVQSLSALMKASMRSDSHLITVAQELEHARRYIEIMEIRFAERLAFEIEVDSSLHECKVVQIILQPLIENAIEHGIRPTRRPGKVSVSCERERDWLTFIIRDDGAGIPAGELEELNSRLKREYTLESDHIGLRNVNQRIKLLFGEAAGITVKSESGRGTDVYVRLPFIEG
ncbi:sensor histidine kinase [Paenibacillus daejeonensis]|uniref:sensor histidine kinase n=1 Tax=Paenibacillus daejeonensis TaxID=135193 RepID=UPI000375C3A4|nr:sensor histidine kinase [Paenibacillus daejeonensis]